MLGYGNFRELDIESRLARALEAIVSKTKSNSSRRINAVRWFNRLYYDLAKWQRRLIDLLNTFPGFRNDALEEDYRDFRERLRKFANDLTIYAGPSDFCARLDFLSARLVKDFDWLHDENPQAYDELEALIGIATFSPHRFHDLTASIYSRFQHVVSDTLGEKYRTDKIPSLGDDSSEDATRLSNSRSAQEMRAAIETYSVESWKAIEGIRTAAQRIGVSLLSVDEYDQAINTEGSSNPNIVVLGETVTMSRDTSLLS